MANVNSPYGFQFQRNLAAGASIVTNRFITASNAALSPGDPVVLASGLAKLAGITSTALFGVSLESVTATAATKKSALVIPALKDYLFAAQCSGTTNITQGYIGKKAGIAGTTNGKLTINVAATTSVLQIVGLKPGSSFGTYAELLFVICKSAYQST